MIKIRFYQEITDEEEAGDDPVLQKEGKIYRRALVKKCEENLSPYQAFQEYAPLPYDNGSGFFLQEGLLFTIERENSAGHVEAYIYVGGVLVAVPDVIRHSRPNGTSSVRTHFKRDRENRSIDQKESPPLKEEVIRKENASPDSSKASITEDFLLHVRHFVKSYSTMEALHQKQDDIKAKDALLKEQRKDQPEQDKPDQSKDDECL